MDEIEQLKGLLKDLEKEKPDVQKDYCLFPNRDKTSVKRVGFPTYALQYKVDGVRVDAVVISEAVRKAICEEYGWEFKKPSLTRIEYYQAILPLVCSEEIEVGEDFSTMEADQMIQDFLVCTYA